MLKDVVLTASRQRTEIWTAVICFLIALATNIGAIIYYHTPFYEIFTQIGFTIVIAVGLYVVWTILRILWWLLGKLFKKG